MLPLLDEIPVHCKSVPPPLLSPVPSNISLTVCLRPFILLREGGGGGNGLHTLRIKCFSKEHNGMTWPRLKPTPFDPESAPLVTSPTLLPQSLWQHQGQVPKTQSCKIFISFSANICKIVYDNLRISCRAGDVFFNPFQIILLNAKKQLVTRCSDSHCHWINFDSDTIQRFHELTGLCFLFVSPLMITSGVFLTFLIFMPSTKNEKKPKFRGRTLACWKMPH